VATTLRRADPVHYPDDVSLEELRAAAGWSVFIAQSGTAWSKVALVAFSDRMDKAPPLASMFRFGF
jgi:hypothetical protein